MDVTTLLDGVRRHPEYRGQLEHIEALPPRSASYGQPGRPLADSLVRCLARQGIHQLYTHQVQALEMARGGQNLVIVTGTASGKTLCYNLPILEACLADPEARALYLFPTKALAQDQLKGLLQLTALSNDLATHIRPGVYDGDTPTAQRRRIQAEANLVLSNPDMLHASILPYHPKWSRLFSHLRFVVVDEVHTYRGILGAHVACVLRRLERVCRHYGSRPIFLAASATIANPSELTSRLIDRPVATIDQDGSPRGPKFFALWNPSRIGRDSLARCHATDDAVWLLVQAIEAGAQTLVFTRTRQAAELVHRYAQDLLCQRRSPLAQSIRAYRGGYLPNERRQIEQQLASGQLRGVATTNALELGIDIGSLDVTLLVHYPGTIASTWQQAGRSGRRHDASLTVLLAGNDPVDQYLVRHPHFLFGQSPEHAVVDPDNAYVLANHLKAAAFELPLVQPVSNEFSPQAQEVAQILRDAGDLNEVVGRFYFAGGQNPASRISLRHMSENTFTIVLRQPDGRHAAIGNVDAISAPELIYPEAVYLHHGETYFIRQLDVEGRVAYAQRREMDYYTQAVLDSRVQIQLERCRSDQLPRADVRFGDVDVSWQTVSFKKIRFHTRENIGYGKVDLAAQNLTTTAFWVAPADSVCRALRAGGLRTSEGLCGLRNLAVQALPLIAMCDSRDISGVVDSQNLGRPVVILYDRYPGGLGYCEKGFQHIAQLLELCDQMVSECDCAEGCPRCVGLPNLRPAIHSDPDLTRGYPMPDKQATIQLLDELRQEDAFRVRSPTSSGAIMQCAEGRCG